MTGSDSALRLALREIGLRLRRDLALMFGGPVVPLENELAGVRAAFLARLDAEWAPLAARSAASRERLRRMNIRGWG